MSDMPFNLWSELYKPGKKISYTGENSFLTKNANTGENLHTNFFYRFFARYFLQKIQSIYKFNIEKLPLDFFLNVLFTRGFIVILETPGYGVICQDGGITGQNIYYQPNKIVISNPYIKGLEGKELVIGRDCEIIRLTPDWCGVYDIVEHFATLSALLMVGMEQNIKNTKFAYIFGAKNSNIAESLKKLSDNILSGETVAFADKKLFNDNGDIDMTMFNQNIKNTFIGNDLNECLLNIERRFNTLVGIPNANTEKKERLISAEVNINNVSTYCLRDLWFDELKKSIEIVNSHFNTNYSVEYRFKGGDDIVS